MVECIELGLLGKERLDPGAEARAAPSVDQWPLGHFPVAVFVYSFARLCSILLLFLSLTLSPRYSTFFSCNKTTSRPGELTSEMITQAHLT